MSQYRAYPAYKDSGVEWIGQVPEHWKIAQIKRISALNPRKSTLSEEKDSLCTFLPMEKLRTNAVTLDETRPIHEVYGGYSYFCDGDILIAKVTPCFENGNIAVANGLVNGIGFGSTEINVLRVNGKGHNRFLYYRLQEEQFRTIAKSEMRGTGGLKRVPTDLFESFTIGLPDTDEQATIAATLDQETARIDALIEKKTRFIELLKEKRQALITHAVTKGLDPNVKMKDSGVEWIGQVPEHWEVKPFFALVTELNRKNVGLVETNILSLSYGNIIQKPETRNMGLTPESYETYQIVESGEIVFRFTDLQNDKRSLRSAQVTQRGIITSAYMAVKPQSIDSTYFAWLMRSYDLCKVFYAMGGGLRQSLKFEDVRRLPVLIPPVDEQSAITNTINAGTARIDALVEKTEQSITLLKERRAAFITAAVTGQIDLRGKQ
ncbi:TPA: restriction endonuclease subunit S [Klebsiella pneumoniae]|uniref:Restriction endonuclease subunit S n=2 Tax=Enterobacteriaceae TaxID=543 RepID=A0A731V598_SALET|nr:MULTISPECIES: restriction endonuclease subunit S [Enterobacterales]EFE7784064.1 restriction endonuclease subunit S [Escherichia coli]MBU9716600.1 restriction endonuclease subunit S [Klebsiella pneumoniae subsp. ozaenae]MEB1165676.1 restriction endonuclease subunit S [Citrobacter freundii]HAE4776166.1 restriction endonuclease subunit S [Salmonella enterica subsp. enterica serovar Poona]AYJ95015.1 restriction endonuclease subunit S [Klebsiella pneumoniae]